MMMMVVVTDISKGRDDFGEGKGALVDGVECVCVWVIVYVHKRHKRAELDGVVLGEQNARK